MTHRRGMIRAALALGFAADPHFADVTTLSAWAQNIDADTLPVLGIATPRETKDQDAHHSAERIVMVVVVLKRLGGDEIEDVLDADSDRIEAVTLGSIRTMGVDCELEQTALDIDGASARRLGTLTMTFRAFVRTDEPLTL